MTDTSVQIFLFLAGIIGWALCASPLLKYMIYAAEKDYRWPLAGWFALITASIFVVKFCLFALCGWPVPGTWPSRLFYPLMLFAAYGVPFAQEVMRGVFFKRK